MDKKKGSRDPEKFIEQFIQMLRPRIYEGCRSMYDEAIKSNETDGIKVFMVFLKGVPNWPDNVLNDEVRRITHETQMGDYLEKMFNIIMKTTILDMTGMPNSRKNEIKCPDDITLKRCIHQIYTKVAEEIFLNPHIFNNNINEVDEQKISENEKLINEQITRSIRDSINALTPIEYILDNYHGLDTEISEKKPPIIIQQGGSNVGIHFTSVVEQRSESPLINEHSIQDIKPKHPVSEKVKEMSEKPKYTSPVSERQVKQIKEQPLIKVSDIAPRQNDIEESEAYHQYKSAPIDVFSNKVYSNEVSAKQTTPSVNTDEIKKYALNHPKANMTRETDNNTSIKNYVPSKKINNTRI